MQSQSEQYGEIKEIDQLENNFSEYEDDDYSSKLYTTTWVRKDVMHKTIFRSVRREYKEYFKMFCEFKGIKISRTARYLEEAIKQFTEYILGWEDRAQLHSQYGPMFNLKYYVGLFSEFWKMRKIAEKYSDNTYLHNFYDCLYGYSHKKFYEFLLIPEVNFLMKKMLDRDHIEIMFLKCPTFRKHEKQYRRWTNSLVSFMNRNMKNLTL